MIIGATQVLRKKIKDLCMGYLELEKDDILINFETLNTRDKFK